MLPFYLILKVNEILFMRDIMCEKIFEVFGRIEILCICVGVRVAFSLQAEIKFKNTFKVRRYLSRRQLSMLPLKCNLSIFLL